MVMLLTTYDVVATRAEEKYMDNMHQMHMNTEDETGKKPKSVKVFLINLLSEKKNDKEELSSEKQKQKLSEIASEPSARSKNNSETYWQQQLPIPITQSTTSPS